MNGCHCNGESSRSSLAHGGAVLGLVSVISAVAVLAPPGVGAQGRTVQGRTFDDEPSFVLGLRADRSASITLADIDGDHDLDVLVANTGTDNLVYFGDGTGRFGDGYADVGIANSDGSNGIHLNRLAPGESRNGR